MMLEKLEKAVRDSKPVFDPLFAVRLGFLNG